MAIGLERLFRFVRIQAERMAGGVEQCTGSFEVLLAGQASSQAEGVADGFLQVVDVEVEVEHLSLSPFLPGPDGWFVFFYLLEGDDHAGGRGDGRPAVCLRVCPLPVEETAVKGGHEARVLTVDHDVDPVDCCLLCFHVSKDKISFRDMEFPGKRCYSMA